jgi:hypothetical protein
MNLISSSWFLVVLLVDLVVGLVVDFVDWMNLYQVLPVLSVTSVAPYRAPKLSGSTSMDILNDDAGSKIFLTSVPLRISLPNRLRSDIGF